METRLIIIAFLSISGLVALAGMSYLAYRRHGYLYVLITREGNIGQNRFIRLYFLKALTAVSFVSLFVIFYLGISSLLSWIPVGLGEPEYDGDWKPYRNYISAFLSFLAAIITCDMYFNYIAHKFSVALDRIYNAGMESIIDALNKNDPNKALLALKESFKGKIEGLLSASSTSIGVRSFEEDQANVYRDLIRSTDQLIK